MLAVVLYALSTLAAKTPSRANRMKCMETWRAQFSSVDDSQRARQPRTRSVVVLQRSVCLSVSELLYRRFIVCACLLPFLGNVLSVKSHDDDDDDDDDDDHDARTHLDLEDSRADRYAGCFSLLGIQIFSPKSSPGFPL